MRHAHHRRFFVPADHIQDGRVQFSPAQTHQILHVLRLGRGDQVTAFDGAGRECVARLDGCAGRAAVAAVLHERRAPAPFPRITLAHVIPRGPAMDEILAHATALGAARLVPLEADRSVRRLDERVPRWLRIAQEAAEQSGRTDLPEVAAPCTLAAFLTALPAGCPVLACDAAAREPLLAAALELRGADEVALLVGGEGGLSDEELRAVAPRARLVSLGPRLLRSATAVLAALAILQAAMSLGETDAPDSRRRR